MERSQCPGRLPHPKVSTILTSIIQMPWPLFEHPINGIIQCVWFSFKHSIISFGFLMLLFRYILAQIS